MTTSLVSKLSGAKDIPHTTQSPMRWNFWNSPVVRASAKANTIDSLDMSSRADLIDEKRETKYALASGEASTPSSRWQNQSSNLVNRSMDHN